MYRPEQLIRDIKWRQPAKWWQSMVGPRSGLKNGHDVMWCGPTRYLASRDSVALEELTSKLLRKFGE